MWTDRLTEYVEKKRHVPFKWGTNDCVTFAIKGMEYIFDTDLFAKVDVRWKNEKEAKAAIKEKGPTFEEALLWFLTEMGLESAPIGFASRGDLVVHVTANGPTCTLCVGDKVIAPGPNGIEFMPVEGQCWKYKGDR
jgi:hypothetical protein